ncbi:MAG: PfkB family carbohydrate kinase [Rectinemataceae bacterium]|jgi:sugar/nucleoside kinase (ribokinase family)
MRMASGSAGLGGFDRGDLERITRAFPSIRVAVLGDFFLDKYLEVDPALAEISLETGKTAHQAIATRHSPGAAGTVVCNLAALGAGAMRAIGFRGDDGEGYELCADLAAMGCDTRALHLDRGRRTPTYLKPRDRDAPGLEGEHSRYDLKNRLPTSRELEERILASLDEALPELDALIVVDQVEEPGIGAMTRRIVEALPARLAPYPRLVAWADSRRRIMDFRGLILKMNQFELAGIRDPKTGYCIPEDIILEALPRAAERAGAAVFATAAERGVWTVATSSAGGPIHVPALRVDGPVDPTGAGDSFTAGAVLALAAGASLEEAALVGNLVASVTVRQLATTGTARPEELFPALDLWLEANA